MIMDWARILAYITGTVDQDSRPSSVDRIRGGRLFSCRDRNTHSITGLL